MKRLARGLALVVAAALAVSLTACTSNSQEPASNDRLIELKEATGLIEVTPGEALSLISELPGLVIFDIRTQPEYEIKHITNAHLVDLQIPDATASLVALSPAASYLIYGADKDDYRTAAAGQALVQAGLQRVYWLQGGLKTWEGGTTAS